MHPSFEITTRIGCSNNCSYCPQSTFVKSYKKNSGEYLLSLSTFKKLIEKIPTTRHIVFSGFAEPFLNPECAQMIRYAHDKGFTLEVYTTAAGLTPAIIDQLKDIPFNNFCLHLADNQQLTKIPVTKTALATIEHLFTSNILGFTCIALQNEKQTLSVHPKIMNLLKKHHVPYTTGMLTTRASNLPSQHVNIAKKKKKKLYHCPRTQSNILLPNGDVLLCCMDWSQKHRLGNLLTESYEQLLKSKESEKVKKGFDDPSIDTLCRTCEWSREKKTIRDRLREGLQQLINAILR